LQLAALAPAVAGVRTCVRGGRLDEGESPRTNKDCAGRRGRARVVGT
jgi:hypothetical protein